VTPCSKDPDKWFSEEIFDVKAAKRICNQGCPATTRSKCLELGMSEDSGVWGGLSTYERVRLRRRKAA
jgi:hypothetical protein